MKRGQRPQFSFLCLTCGVKKQSQRGFDQLGHGLIPPGRLAAKLRHHRISNIERGLHMGIHILDMVVCQRPNVHLPLVIPYETFCHCRESEKILCRAKTEKSLQHSGHVRGRRLAAHSSGHADFPSFRNTELGRAASDSYNHRWLSNRAGSGVAVRFHATRNCSNRGPASRGHGRRLAVGQLDGKIDRRA